MPTIVYQENPKTHVKYAYESISYWDKDKKAPRSKRRYLGRVDPETGEIIESKRKRKEPEEVPGQDMAQLMESLEKKDAEIAALKNTLQELTSRYEEIFRILNGIRELTLSASSSPK
jgi:hypothetical protein